MIGFKGKLLSGAVWIALGAGLIRAQVPCDSPQTDSSRIGSDGTAYVTRVVPVPKTISPEAQKVLARVVTDAAAPQTLEQRRPARIAGRRAQGNPPRSCIRWRSLRIRSPVFRYG